MRLTGPRRPIVTLCIAWAMVLLTGQTALADGAEEFAAGQGLFDGGDYIGALVQWQDAADKGHVGAMHDIGLLYVNGHGVKQDYAAALRWFRKAADKGYAGSMHNIGVLYEHGRGVKQDYAEAMRWYRKAADTGVASSTPRR